MNPRKKIAHAIERHGADRMTGKADDSPTAEEIASELNRIADAVRQGPMDSAAVAQLIARVEAMRTLLSQRPEIDPAIAKRLQQLAGELRSTPVKRKNGPTA